MDFVDIALAIVSSFLAAFVFSTVGFGIGMTSTPMLLFVFDPQTVVVVVNTVSLVLFVLIIIQTRSSLPIRQITPISISGVLGVPLGIFVLDWANASILRLGITILIIFLTLAVAINRQSPILDRKFAGIFVGFIVGILITSTGVGAIFLVLFLLARNWSKNAMRGGLSLYFLFLEGTAVLSYLITGMMTFERIVLISISIIPALMGFGLASLVVSRMNEDMFQRAVILVIIVTSLIVIVREITAL